MGRFNNLHTDVPTNRIAELHTNGILPFNNGIITCRFANRQLGRLLSSKHEGGGNFLRASCLGLRLGSGKGIRAVASYHAGGVVHSSSGYVIMLSTFVASNNSNCSDGLFSNCRVKSFGDRGLRAAITFVSCLGDLGKFISSRTTPVPVMRGWGVETGAGTVE